MHDPIGYPKVISGRSMLTDLQTVLLLNCAQLFGCEPFSLFGIFGCGSEIGLLYCLENLVPEPVEVSAGPDKLDCPAKHYPKPLSVTAPLRNSSGQQIDLR
jgi:hypothetical protein